MGSHVDPRRDRAREEYEDTVKEPGRVRSGFEWGLGVTYGVLVAMVSVFAGLGILGFTVFTVFVISSS